MLDADGREVPFVTGEVTVARPTWMGDDELAFVARRDGDERRGIYRISTAGGEARKLFEYETNVVSFDVSPDGGWLAFLAADKQSADRVKLENQGFNQEIFEEELLFTRLRVADLESGRRARRSGSEDARGRRIAAVAALLSGWATPPRWGYADAARRRRVRCAAVAGAGSRRQG